MRIKQLKILMVHDVAYNYGGGEVYLLTLKKSLESKGHIVRIFAANPENKKELFADVICKAADDTLLGKFRGLHNFDAKKKLKKELKEFQPDIVHFHSAFYRLSPSIFSLLKKIPVVFTLHNYAFNCMSGYKYYPDNYKRCTHRINSQCRKRKCVTTKEYYYQLIKRILFKKALKKVDLFLPCSNYGAKLMRDDGYTNVKVIHHGLPDKGKPKPFPKEKQILFVGRLVIEKGIQHLLKAFEIIKNNHPDAKLIIVGEGPYIDTAKKMAGKNVKFTGNIPNDQIRKYYDESQIFCVPSIWPENSPITLYETMLYGRPAVITNVGGMPDLVIDELTGKIVPLDENKILAKTIIELLNDKKKLIKMGEEARKRYENNFTIEHNIKNILNTYYEVIK